MGSELVRKNSPVVRLSPLTEAMKTGILRKWRNNECIKEFKRRGKPASYKKYMQLREATVKFWADPYVPLAEAKWGELGDMGTLCGWR